MTKKIDSSFRKEAAASWNYGSSSCSSSYSSSSSSVMTTNVMTTNSYIQQKTVPQLQQPYGANTPNIPIGSVNYGETGYSDGGSWGNTINEYEKSAPAIASIAHIEQDKNASSYISYLIDQINEMKEKLEVAEKKIKILSQEKGIEEIVKQLVEANNRASLAEATSKKSKEEWKDFLVKQIDEFLVAKKEAMSMTPEEIFANAVL